MPHVTEKWLTFVSLINVFSVRFVKLQAKILAPKEAYYGF